MPFYIYNAAPGPLYFRGNEIKAEAARWTEVSAVSVNYGTFNTMKRLNLVYVVETDSAPTYNPTHPDNRSRAEADAPGAKTKAADFADGSMDSNEIKKFLNDSNVSQPNATVPKDVPGELNGNTEKLSFDDLETIGEPAAAKPAKVTKAKAAKSNITPATDVSPAVDNGPSVEGSWS